MLIEAEEVDKDVGWLAKVWVFSGWLVSFLVCQWVVLGGFGWFGP